MPEDVRARILLATRLAFSQQDADESIRHLQTAVALRPNDPSTLYNAACTYGILGKKAEALETYKKALTSASNSQHYKHWAANDPDLACLYDDPEFQKLVALN